MIVYSISISCLGFVRDGSYGYVYNLSSEFSEMGSSFELGNSCELVSSLVMVCAY